MLGAPSFNPLMIELFGTSSSIYLTHSQSHTRVAQTFAPGIEFTFNYNSTNHLLIHRRNSRSRTNPDIIPLIKYTSLIENCTIAPSSVGLGCIQSLGSQQWFPPIASHTIHRSTRPLPSFVIPRRTHANND